MLSSALTCLRVSILHGGSFLMFLLKLSWFTSTVVVFFIKMVLQHLHEYILLFPCVQMCSRILKVIDSQSNPCTYAFLPQIFDMLFNKFSFNSASQFVTCLCSREFRRILIKIYQTISVTSYY